MIAAKAFYPVSVKVVVFHVILLCVGSGAAFLQDGEAVRVLAPPQQTESDPNGASPADIRGREN